MQYTESYEIHTARHGEETLIMGLLDATEAEAMEEWRVESKFQDKGTRVTLVRVMTVTVASSSK